MSETTALDKPLEKINVAEALRLRIENKLTFREIGEKFGCSPQAVEQKLSRFKAFLEDTGHMVDYDAAKVQLFNMAEWRLLQSCVDEDAILKGSLNNRAYALRQVHDINQANKGLSQQSGGVTINIRVCAGAADRGQDQTAINVTPTVQVSSSGEQQPQDIDIDTDNGQS